MPFVHGGAETHVRELTRELQARGFETELVSIPFKWYPKDEILPHAAAWRLIDLSESNGRPVDLVIATKFPTYFVRHPNKVGWLIHQYRAAYELCGTPYSDFGHNEQDVGLRNTLIRLDTQMLGECRRLFANARNTASRVAKFNGLATEPLYHPPRLAPRLVGGPYGDYVLSVGRLESVKRVDLIVSAMAHVDRPLRLVIAGDGTQRANVERAAAESGLNGRVDFLGTVDDDRLVALYRDALAVVYPPYDEDFGYVTLEAFLSKKPVVTASDSGGPNEFVVDGVNGFVCAPEPAALADAINRLAADRRRAASFGEAGYARAAQVTWDGVIEKLVGQASAGAPDAAAALGWPAGGESPQATASAQRGGEAQRGPTERSDS
ncbi:MAG TPA: glycosyltransferase family 4 protein [Vicinamibacterales bacterium]